MLRELGFDVSRRHGHVWTAEADRGGTFLDHLVLHVAGLPSPDNPGGEWWPDVGLGDGFRDPLPLVAGEWRPERVTYTIEEVRADGWSFRHDPTGSFTGCEVTSTLATDPVRRPRGARRALRAPASAGSRACSRCSGGTPAGTTTIRGCLRTEDAARTAGGPCWTIVRRLAGRARRRAARSTTSTRTRCATCMSACGRCT